MGIIVSQLGIEHHTGGVLRKIHSFAFKFPETEEITYISCEYRYIYILVLINLFVCILGIERVAPTTLYDT